MKDIELLKLTRNMAVDEKEIFLEVYGKLDAAAARKALQQTAVKLAKQRREKAQAARARIPEIEAEMTSLNKTFADWRKDNFDAFLTEAMGRNRGRVQSLLREREKLESIIQQENIK